MFDGLAAERHSVGQMVKPSLHCVKHGLMFPALEAFDLLGRATRSELAT
jgi:hypothetical protein